MADAEKKSQSFDYSDRRFKYIGFEVFPGKAGNIFKSEEEKKTLIQRVRERLTKSQGEVRERCTLMESRISRVEMGFLTAAAIIMVVALFLPWYSGTIPVSYEEVGAVSGTSFYYSSDQDERLIGYVTDVLKKNHQRTLEFAGMLSGAEPEEATESPGTANEPAEEMDESTGSLPGDTAPVAATGEPAADTAVQDTTVQAAAPAEDAVSPILRTVFVNVPQKDSLRRTEDLRQHVVAYFEYNGLTGEESFTYGTGPSLASLPGIMSIAQRNDSLIEARLAKIRKDAEEAGKPSRRTTAEQRQARVDSILADTARVGARMTIFGDQSITTSEMTARGIVNDSYSMSGIGALAGLGTYFPMIFSSGPVLIITGILMVLFYISCPVLAVLNLYVLYGMKKNDADQYVLTLKKWLRYNWIPVFLWLAMFILSFFGAPYGFDSTGMVQQVGSSYNIAAFIGLSSMGIYLVLMASLITALKGKEI